MVDFSDALRTRIESMSPDELAATEARRIARVAEQSRNKPLTATWEPPKGSSTKESLREITVRIDPAAEGDDVLRFAADPSFHETIILTPSIYRLIAGGASGSAQLQTGMPDRFTINAGGASYDKVTIDRADLAAAVGRERPEQMARASRLVALERQSAMRGIPGAQLVSLFEERWDQEVIGQAINAAVGKLPSRALFAITGKDHVALWVRREDLTAGPGRILGSVLASAIVRTDDRAARSPALVPKPNGGEPSAATYLLSTFGSGPERTLVLDVAKVRKLIPAIPHKEGRDMNLAMLRRLIDRSAMIAHERAQRSHPLVHKSVVTADKPRAKLSG